MTRENDDPNPACESTATSSLDDATRKITALDREKAKNETLLRQLDRAKNESDKLKNELKRTQQQLENQMKQTLQLRKQQQRQNAALREQRALEIDRRGEEMEELEKMRADLAREISSAKQRETKLQRAVEQCAEYEKELRELKQQQVNVEGNELAVKQLQRQRDQLLVVVKKQMKLCDVLKQQALHAKAATLLDISEKDFLKELNVK